VMSSIKRNSIRCGRRGLGSADRGRIRRSSGTPSASRADVTKAQARLRLRGRLTVDLLAGATVAVRAAVAARSARTAAIALTNVPMPAASVPSAVTAPQAWPGSAIGAFGQRCGVHPLVGQTADVSVKLSRSAPRSAIPKKTTATLQRNRARPCQASTVSSPAASGRLSCPFATIVHRQSQLLVSLALFDVESSARWPAP